MTFHPETLEADKTINNLMELLGALETFDDETSILFTLANAK